MTRSEILFNYRQAIRQADRLDDIAKKLSRLTSNQMNSTIGTLKSAWKSDNSPQYYSKMSKVQEDIKDDASDLKKIAQAIRDTAEQIKQAELRALEIAESRSYSS